MARAPGRELLFHEILAKKSTAGSSVQWLAKIVAQDTGQCPVSCKSFMWSDSLLCIV